MKSKKSKPKRIARLDSNNRPIDSDGQPVLDSKGRWPTMVFCPTGRGTADFLKAAKSSEKGGSGE